MSIFLPHQCKGAVIKYDRYRGKEIWIEYERFVRIFAGV